MDGASCVEAARCREEAKVGLKVQTSPELAGWLSPTGPRKARRDGRLRRNRPHAFVEAYSRWRVTLSLTRPTGCTPLLLKLVTAGPAPLFRRR